MPRKTNLAWRNELARRKRFTAQLTELAVDGVAGMPITVPEESYGVGWLEEGRWLTKQLSESNWRWIDDMTFRSSLEQRLIQEKERFDEDNRTCALGALDKYAATQMTAVSAENRLNEVASNLYGRGVIGVNDRIRSRTNHKRVLRVFDKAIKLEEQRLAKAAKA